MMTGDVLNSFLSFHLQLFFSSVTLFLWSIFLDFFIQNAPALATHNLAILYLAYLVPYRFMKINSSVLTILFLVLALKPQHSALLASAHLAPKNELIGPFNRHSLFLLILYKTLSIRRLCYFNKEYWQSVSFRESKPVKKASIPKKPIYCNCIFL